MFSVGTCFSLFHPNFEVSRGWVGWEKVSLPVGRMGVVSCVVFLHAMDLLIRAPAFQLGADIKLPWEREPIKPVFAKRPRLLQPPKHVMMVKHVEENVSLPIEEAEGRITWCRTASLVPWPIAQDRALARTLESWRIIVMDNLAGTMVGRQIEESLNGDPQSRTAESSISDALSGKSIST